MFTVRDGGESVTQDAMVIENVGSQELLTQNLEHPNLKIVVQVLSLRYFYMFPFYTPKTSFHTNDTVSQWTKRWEQVVFFQVFFATQEKSHSNSSKKWFVVSSDYTCWVSDKPLCNHEVRPCVFPFQHEGVEYNTCTTAGDSGSETNRTFSWCATKTSDDGRWILRAECKAVTFPLSMKYISKSWTYTNQQVFFAKNFQQLIANTFLNCELEEDRPKFQKFWVS